MGKNMQGGGGRTKSFFLRQMLVIGWLTHAVLAQTEDPGKCPERWCVCHLYYHPSDGESMRVECRRGGMVKVPVNELERDIHQLIISPDPSKPNNLTIGPFLTQPEPFYNLRDLTIAYSNIPSVGHHCFWGLHKLRTLNLTGNNITSLTMENFRGLVNLTFLTLDNNKIEQMASETFRYMDSLLRLSLAHNKITTLVPRLFRLLGKLEKLDLSYNPLKDLSPEVFADIQNLLILKCRQCLLRRVNDQIYNLASQIEELDLGQNKFKFLIDDDFINLKKLKRLDFDGNQISVIVDNVFKENKEMTFLNLARNRIALLAPGTLNDLTKLSHLDLSYNRISKLPHQAFSPVLKSLTTIKLSGNNLSVNEVAALLQILPQIDDVGLANLSLKDIPSNFFSNNMRLESLDFSKNLLTKFPYDAIKNLKHLKNLDLSYNKITALEEQDLRRLESIANIRLSPNTWHCDQCSVGLMMDYLKTTVLNESLRGLRCHSPLRLYGFRLADLTTDMLDACSLRFEAQMSIFAGLLLVLVAVLATGAVALCCTRRRESNYYTNEDKRRDHCHEHPEELLTSNQIDSVATIHSPFHPTPNSS